MLLWTLIHYTTTPQQRKCHAVPYWIDSFCVFFPNGPKHKEAAAPTFSQQHGGRKQRGLLGTWFRALFLSLSLYVSTQITEWCGKLGRGSLLSRCVVNLSTVVSVDCLRNKPYCQVPQIMAIDPAESTIRQSIVSTRTLETNVYLVWCFTGHTFWQLFWHVSKQGRRTSSSRTGVLFLEYTTLGRISSRCGFALDRGFGQ